MFSLSIKSEAPIWFSSRNPFIAGVDGTRYESNRTVSGIISSGHIKPTLNIRGSEENKIAGVAISREEKREPIKRPKAITAVKKSTPKSRRSVMFAICVTPNIS